MTINLKTLVKVPSVQEQCIGVLLHDGILLSDHPRHASVAVLVLLPAPRRVHAHLLEVGVDVVHMDDGQIEHVSAVPFSAVNRLIGEVVQLRRRPLLGPSPG